MTRSARRGPWLLEEDQALMELVRTQGPNNWVRISQQLQHRSPKQCRERYHQNLKPSLNHEPISAQEGEMIEQMVHEMGKRWAEIARRLGNRSDNAVKNWWNGSMNRRKRQPPSDPGNKFIEGQLHRSSTGPATCGPYIELPPFQPQNGHEGFNPSIKEQNVWPPKQKRLTGDTRPSSLYVHDHHFRSTTFPSPTITFGAGPRLSRPEYSQSQPDLTLLRPIDGHTPASTQLPPLRLPVVPPSQPGWHSPSFLGSEHILVSPALSETSQGVSSRQEPSLISDNQSTYSNSPRNVTSPRAFLPAPYESSSTVSRTYRSGAAIELPRILNRDRNSAVLTDEEDTSSCVGGIKNTYIREDSTMQDVNLSISPTETRVDSIRDTRMHVSSLLD